jgi:hypothetical protein
VRQAASFLEPRWRSAVFSAAWLHDIGYSEEIADSGLHQLDGARWLRDRGWSMDVSRLVAWHTASDVEGGLRGLDAGLTSEFAPPPPLPLAVLTWADLTSSPLGVQWTPERRLADILDRHPAHTVVHQAIVSAWPRLLDAVRTIERLVPDTALAR